jgi:uncharacterized integral membrane protein
MAINVNSDKIESDANPNIKLDGTYKDGHIRSERPVGHTGAYHVDEFDHTGRDSWKVMFDRLYVDMSRLMERERLLFKTEVKEKVSDLKNAIGSLVVAGSLLFVGVFALVATTIILLNLVMPLWASALIVTAILFIVGGILIGNAKKKLDADHLKPKQSIETFGEMTNTFKETINEYRQKH